MTAAVLALMLLIGASSGAQAASPVFLGTLAGPAPASMYVGGLEWDAVNSRIVVADTGLDMVSFYDPVTGNLLPGSFGGYGTGPRQFDAPRDIAIDGAANIYVADANNNRVQKFDMFGNFIWSKASLVTPLGVTFDSANNQLLVAESGDSLIKALDPSTGNVMWVSPAGLSLGFTQPRDATRGPEGLIWVSAYTQNEIRAYAVTPTGTWATSPTVILGDGVKNGRANNEVINPYNVAFSPDGKTVYVSDIGNDRIVNFDIHTITLHPPAGTPFGRRCQIPCPDAPASAGRFAFLRRVAVETNGYIIGGDLEGNQIQIFSPAGINMKQIGGIHSHPPGFTQVYGVTVGPDGTIYAVDRANQRMEMFSSAGSYITSGGYRGVGAARVSWPEAAAVAPDKTVWLADTRNARLEHWPANLSSTSVPSVGTKGKGLGQFNYMEGITVDSSGVVWVADTGNNRIQSYNPSNGTFVAIGSLGSGNGQFNQPQGIAISATDIYVADTGNSRIEELTLSGTYVTSFTGLNHPQGIALAPDGTLWVAETGNNDIVHLSGDLSTNLGDGFGSFGTGNYGLFAPHSLAVFGNTLYVADTYNNRVQEFDITGA
jgi:tripartite motif-containing protein 71